MAIAIVHDKATELIIVANNKFPLCLLIILVRKPKTNINNMNRSAIYPKSKSSLGFKIKARAREIRKNNFAENAIKKRFFLLASNIWKTSINGKKPTNKCNIKKNLSKVGKKVLA